MRAVTVGATVKAVTVRTLKPAPAHPVATAITTALLLIALATLIGTLITGLPH